MSTRFCEFTGDDKHAFDEVGFKKACEHVGFVPKRAEQSLCMKHDEPVQKSAKGWRLCCDGCTTPVQVVG